MRKFTIAQLGPSLQFTIKLILLVFTFYILHFTFYISPALAQTSTPSSSFPASRGEQPQYLVSLPSGGPQLPTSISPTSPLFTDMLLHNMFHTFSCLAVGSSVIGQPCLTYQVTKNAEGAIQSIPVLSQVNLSDGALGATTSLIGALYTNPPVRSADYLASLGQGLGVVKEANAQVIGSGQAVLNPILSLWKVSRNIAYLIMIIIFIVIGVMVMFRNRINPQTVITAQAALPGLVIGLILITFSYFLAGLVSDIAFVGTNVVGYYFVSAEGKLVDPDFKDQLNLTKKLSDTNILKIMGSLTGIVDSGGFLGLGNVGGDISKFVGTVFDNLGDAAQGSIRILVWWVSSQFLSPFIPTDVSISPWALAIKPIVGLLGGGIAATVGISPLLGLVLGLASSLALVYQMLKLFFRLITAWLTIIFLTITAPFQFLFASLPGRQGIATNWILSMLGNILIFPAVIAVIYFVIFLLGSAKYNQICPKDTSGQCLIKIASADQAESGTLISPAYAADGASIIGTQTFPLFGGMDLSFVRLLLAFGALMALPAIPDIIVRSVGRAGQAGQMIGQEIMSGAGFGQRYAQRTYGAGLASGQDIQTGLTGKTGINAQGDLSLSQQGLLRRGTGTIRGGQLKGGKVSKWIWQ